MMKARDNATPEHTDGGNTETAALPVIVEVNPGGYNSQQTHHQEDGALGGSRLRLTEQLESQATGEEDADLPPPVPPPIPSQPPNLGLDFNWEGMQGGVKIGSIGGGDALSDRDPFNAEGIPLTETLYDNLNLPTNQPQRIDSSISRPPGNKETELLYATVN